METRANPILPDNHRGGDGHRFVPFSRLQHQAVDWLGLMHRRHTAHLLLEMDVTRAGEALRAHQASTGEEIPLTAYVAACLARAVAEDSRMQAYRAGRDRLLLFDDVDVALVLDRDVEDAEMPPPHRSLGRTPHIIRAANTKSPATIACETRAAETEQSPITVWLPFWLLLPAWMRALIWMALLADPRLRKRITGTVALSSIDVPGSESDALSVGDTGRRWAIPLVAYTLSVDLGSITRKPGVATDAVLTGAAEPGGLKRVELREYLCLTISFDDDVIGGARAARFAARLQELIEGDAGLPALAAEPPAAVPAPDDIQPAPDDAARAAAAVTAIKGIHTAIFLGMGSCVAHIVYAGLVGRVSGLTKLAMVTLTCEGAIYSRNGFRCPLADMAEDLGAESGTVGDIFLPGWFEERIPVISSSLLCLAGAAYWLRRARGREW